MMINQSYTNDYLRSLKSLKIIQVFLKKVDQPLNTNVTKNGCRIWKLISELWVALDLTTHLDRPKKWTIQNKTMISDGLRNSLTGLIPDNGYS